MKKIVLFSIITLLFAASCATHKEGCKEARRRVHKIHQAAWGG